MGYRLRWMMDDYDLVLDEPRRGTGQLGFGADYFVLCIVLLTVFTVFCF